MNSGSEIKDEVLLRAQNRAGSVFLTSLSLVPREIGSV